MSGGLDPESVKYGVAGFMGLVAIITSIAAWFARRLISRVDEHDIRLNVIDKNMVEQNKYDEDIKRVYDKMDALHWNVQESVKRFEDEHKITREEIINGNNEIKSILKDSKDE